MKVKNSREEPKYTIGVAARIVDLHPQTLRHYENLGLISPTRSNGNQRLYSEEDLERLRMICRLTNDLGVNLAGVEVILNMHTQIQHLKAEMNRREVLLIREIDQLRQWISRQNRNKIVPFKIPLPPEIDENGSDWSEMNS